MFKARRRIIVFASNICIGFICVFLTLFLVPEASFGLSVGIAGVIFTILLLVSVNLSNNAIERVQEKVLTTYETGLLTSFIERLRFSYTVDDFIEAIHAVAAMPSLPDWNRLFNTSKNCISTKKTLIIWHHWVFFRKIFWSIYVTSNSPAISMQFPKEP